MKLDSATGVIAFRPHALNEYKELQYLDTYKVFRPLYIFSGLRFRLYQHLELYKPWPV